MPSENINSRRCFPSVLLIIWKVWYAANRLFCNKYYTYQAIKYC